MAKRQTRGATRSSNNGTPPWVFFASGFLVGGFVTFLFFLGGVESGDTAAQQAEETQAAPKPAKPDRTTDTRFDFFTLLPEREVIVPEEEPAKAEANAEQYQYILQAGSFKTNEDADRRRAQLLLLGLEAKIEAVKANGDTWHRVYVGPFTSRSKLSKARTTLISEGIETLLLKRKKTG